METQHWLATALDCGYITPQVHDALQQRCQEIGRMLGGMMEKSDLFCGTPARMTREALTTYFVESPSDPDI